MIVASPESKKDGTENYLTLQHMQMEPLQQLLLHHTSHSGCFDTVIVCLCLYIL